MPVAIAQVVECDLVLTNARPSHLRGAVSSEITAASDNRNA